MNFTFSASDFMVTDDDWVNEKLDIIGVIKRDYRKRVNQMTESDIERHVRSKKTTTVYHGTSTFYLMEIVKKGILSRQYTGHSTWEGKKTEREKLDSIPKLIYVTSKLQHYYSFTANQEVEKKHPTEKGNVYPCYFTCEVPTDLLVPDEDSFHSNVFWKKYLPFHTSEGKIPLEWSGEESLNHYLTSAVPFHIPLSYIKEVTILGDENFMDDLLVKHPKSAYHESVDAWASNGGVTTIKLSPVYKKQNRSPLNKTFKLFSLEKSKEEINQFMQELQEKSEPM